MEPTRVEQVNQAITQMDEVSQQNPALVEEAAAAAESLEEQAHNLTQAVAVFNIGTGGAAKPASHSAAAPKRRELAPHQIAERRGTNRSANVARLPAKAKALAAAPRAKVAVASGGAGEEM